MSIEVKFKTDEWLESLDPCYGSPGAACFDLASPVSFVIQPGGSERVDLRIAFEPPVGYHIKIHPRSGLGTKTFVSIANTTGIIDGDYRGTVIITLRVPADGKVLVVNKGDRIVQGELCKDTRAEFVRVQSLTDTARGAGGFGSTGVRPFTTDNAGVPTNDGPSPSSEVELQSTSTCRLGVIGTPPPVEKETFGEDRTFGGSHILRGLLKEMAKELLISDFTKFNVPFILATTPEKRDCPEFSTNIIPHGFDAVLSTKCRILPYPNLSNEEVLISLADCIKRIHRFFGEGGLTMMRDVKEMEKWTTIKRRGVGIEIGYEYGTPLIAPWFSGLVLEIPILLPIRRASNIPKDATVLHLSEFTNAFNCLPYGKFVSE